MGSHLSAEARASQDARLLSAIDEASPNMAAVAKVLRKGANIKQAVYPGLLPSRQARIPTLAPSTPPPWSALMRACYRGHKPVVQLLLQQGAPLGLQAMDGISALMIAAQEGHLHVLQELLKHVQHVLPVQPPIAGVAAPVAASSAGIAPQQIQLQLSDDIGSAAPLVPRSASSFHPILDALDERGQTALLKASALGHGACMEALLRAGANVCVADHLDGMTALHLVCVAAEQGPSRLVTLCLQAGANINRKNHNGQTSLLLAASKDYNYQQEREDRAAAHLHAMGLDDTHKSGSSVMHSGALDAEESKSSSHRAPWLDSGASPSSVVLTLLQNGADANAANHDKYTALMVASWKGHSAVVELLIAHRANLDARAEKGQTALMLAAAQRHSRCAEMLIAAGAGLNIVDEQGHTALHKAAIHGDTHTALCLLRAGVNVHLKENLHGNSALLCAAQHLHSSIVELLLHPPAASPGTEPKSARADARARNHRGESALMLAAARGHTYTSQVLIKGGADLSAVDDEGNNALILASRSGSDGVVELLLDCAGAAGSPALMALLAARNHADESALDQAFAHRHAAVVELLVAAGADPTPDGHAPFHADGHAGSVALANEHPHLREAVERGMAARERYEQRERRYKDVVGFLEQQQRLHEVSPQLGGLAHPSAATPSALELPPASAAAQTAVPVTTPQRAHASSSASALQQTPLTRHSSDLSNSDSPPIAGSSSLSSSNNALSSRPVLEWSVAHVLSWLQGLSLSQYTQSFSDASVDGEMLVELLKNEELLVSELQVQRKIHRIKLLREINKLVHPGTAGSSTVTAASSTTASSMTESKEATESAAVPLTTSISNPLPAATPSVSTASVVESTRPAAASSSSLFPIRPAHASSSSASLFPPPSSGIAPIIAAPQSDIFSGNFDFDNLSGLAPLSAATPSASAASSPAGGASAASSAVPTPSGSGGLLQALEPQRLQSPSMQMQLPRPSPTAVGQEYSPLNHTDLHDSRNGRPPSAAVPRLPLHSPRRIPYSELQLKEVIGQGQFGTVWLGSWRGAPVAIKKLHLEATVLAVSGAPSSAASGGSANANGRSGSGSGSGSGAELAHEQMKLFLQEASLHEQLGNHPNLVTFVGISLPDEHAPPAAASAVAAAANDASIGAGDVCIITQYFPLGSVRDLLITKRTLHKLPVSMLAPSVGGVVSPSPVPLLTLLRLLRDIACGVLHLHLEHCIHRDLAARNFLVDCGEERLSVRVADFGMSRLLQAHAQAAAAANAATDAAAASSSSSSLPSAPAAAPSAFTHSQVGPLKWMSPESILRHEYSAASDAYSFAVAMWEVIAQQAEPYPQCRPLEAAIKAAHDPTFRPTIPAHCPAPLAVLMTHCWAHAPHDRPTFERILARLERMESHLRSALKQVDSGAAASSNSGASATDQWHPSHWLSFSDEQPHSNTSKLVSVA